VLPWPHMTDASTNADGAAATGRSKKRGWRIVGIVAASIGTVLLLLVLLYRDFHGNGRVFGAACSLVGGMSQQRGGGYYRWYDCLSTTKQNTDVGKRCREDDECQGSCTGSLGDPWADLIATADTHPAATCSEAKIMFSSN
jgi:hypothetical protein